MSKAAKKVAERLNIEKDFDTTPPKDWLLQANKEGFAEDDFVFYRRNGKWDKENHCREVQGHCTACGGKDIPIPYSMAYDDRCHVDSYKQKCPACGKRVYFKDWSRYKNFYAREDFHGLICFKKSRRKHAGKNIVYTVSFNIYWKVNREGEAKTSIHPTEMCVFGYEKAVRFKYQVYCGKTGFEYRWNWVQEVKDSWVNDRAYLYPIADGVLENTCLENAKLDIWHRNNGIGTTTKYCEQFLLYPGIENLLTNGLCDCVRDKISGNLPRGAVNWQETSPYKMLGLDRQEIKLFNSKYWTLYDLQSYKWLRDNGQDCGEEYIKFLSNINLLDVIKLAKEYGVSGKKLYCYFKRQHTKCGGAWDFKRTWTDYLVMAQKLGYDIKSEKVLYPPKLRSAHDNAVATLKCVEDEELKVKFEELHEKLAPLAWRSGEFVIFPAKSEAELIHEGKVLEHCVGTYGNSHCKDKPIFFIRHTIAPDEPYYTLQLDMKNKSIIQNRGYKNNCSKDTDPAAIAFGKLWRAEIVQNYNFKTCKFKKTAKRGASAALKPIMQSTA